MKNMELIMPEKFVSDLQNNLTIIPLQGAILNYAWGGTQFIPGLLNKDNKDQKPFAELWIGTHQKGSAKAQIAEETVQLARLIDLFPDKILGSRVLGQFNKKLPYLLKVLDAHKMLSIQVHPSKEQAQLGFMQENMRHIAMEARERNFKDDNHKPEVHVALSDFWMLHGFRPVKEIKQILENIPEFHIFEISLHTSDLAHLYKKIMELPQSQVDFVLAPVIGRLQPLYHAGRLDKNNPDFWAVRAAEQFPLKGGHLDRGIFSIYLLNLLHLKPGQGTFQDAGIPHAYLEGITVELMANSDNVLRGGLTPKHIDVPELLNILNFKAQKPKIINGTKISETEIVYKTPAKEFLLSKININKRKAHTSRRKHGPDTVIVMEGTVEVSNGKNKIIFQQGNIFLAPADIYYKVQAQSKAVLFKATVPM
jgi:mannose-6-phosphate isomerase